MDAQKKSPLAAPTTNGQGKGYRMIDERKKVEFIESYIKVGNDYQWNDNHGELIRCKDCKHRPKEPDLKTYESGFDIEFPEGSKCPCQCSGDGYYSWYPEDDWFCANGERR